MATGDLAYTPFNHQHPFPPDLRMQRDTINARDVISAPIRWEGMLVYVLENQKTYQLQGGLTNEYWVEFLGSGGGDISNAVLYTIQNLTPEQQLQARLNIGAGELLDGLISLGAVTSNVNDVTIASASARINGIIVGQNSPVTINVPPPTAGYTRRDLIVIGEDSIIYLVQGVEVLEGETAITPDVPADTVVLVETFANDTGLQDFEEFALNTFVRFDIGNQGLSLEQRLNARTNIQALSKDTNDSRVGTLTQTGLLTVIGDYIQQVQNGTSSANAWQFTNPLGGGASFRRSGGLTVVSDGDSMTDYLIYRGFDNNGIEVFRVRAGGVTKGGDAINIDDFTTLGQVVGLIEGSEETAYTEMSGDDFFIGYRVDGVDRIEQIFAKEDTDVIVTDVGNIILNPSQSVANFIFTGNGDSGVTEIRGIEGAIDGREIHLTNRSGAIIPIIDSYVGGPANSAFGFAYNLADGETISVEAISNVWELNTLNQVAFSDNLDSVNAKISVGPDGLNLISNIYDKNTGEEVQFKEYTFSTPTTDGIIFIQIGVSYYKRVYNGPVKVQWWGVVANDSTFDYGPRMQLFLDSPYLEKEISGGIFYIYDRVYVRSNTILTGNGTISRTVENRSVSTMDIIESSNIRISGITLDSRSFILGNETGNANSNLRIFAKNIKDIFIDNVTFINSGRDGIYINDYTNVKEPNNIKITNCYFDNITRNGISIINGNNILVDRCTFKLTQLCGIDMEPNNHILPLKNCTVSNSYFEQTNGNTRAVLQASISGGDTPDPVLHHGIYFINNYILGDSSPSSIRINQFFKSKIIGNTIENGNNVALISLSGDNGIVRDNKIKNVVPNTYDSETFYSGAIYGNGKNLRITGNEVTSSNVHGIFISHSDGSVVSGNVISDTGMATSYTGPQSVGVYIQNSNKCVIEANTVFDDKATKTVTHGIFVRVASGESGFDNIIKDNLILNDEITTYSISNHDKQRYVGGNSFTDSVIRNGRLVTALPTATEELRGRVFVINSTGSTNNDRYYIVKNKGGIYEWSEIFDQYRTSVATGSASRTFISTDKQWYLRFTGSAGDLTVPPDTFIANDEIYGEIEGGTKTFVAGAGVTLRSPTGQGLTAPQYSKYNIKFKSANDALVTIIKPYTATEILTGSPTLDFGDILAGESGTLTATVTGAALLDNVNVSGPASIYSANATIDGWVSSTDTVSVRVRNFGGTTINPASGTFNIKVFK